MSLKSREFWVSSTQLTGLCILKPEAVSPSCRDIIVSMLWEMMRACFDFLEKKTIGVGGEGGGGEGGGHATSTGPSPGYGPV